ncbi:IS4 family transposase [Cetobacterium sp.]|uniref:IS4 family transposase n=1 Tax=Cetobacterium sp. TaxID=2071632 RepID=UPI003F3BA664
MIKSTYWNKLVEKGFLRDIANEVGLCKRERKFTPEILLKMAVFQSNNLGNDLLNEISQTLYEDHNIKISKEGLNKRFDSKYVDFLKTIAKILLSLNFENNLESKNLKKLFNHIYLTDSTTIKLHPSLKKDYPVTGNQDSNHAGIKIHLIKDIKTEILKKIDTTKSTTHDSYFLDTLKEIVEENDLILNDLGYYSTKFFKTLIEKKAYFISKLKLFSSNTIFSKNETPEYSLITGKLLIPSQYKKIDIDFECKELKSGEIKEFKEVFLGGTNDKIKCRLIVTRLSDNEEEKRYKKLSKKIQDNRTYIEKSKEELIKYGFMITNVDENKISKENIYNICRLRWQIELEFKNWKSIMEIDESSRKVKKERMECHFWGKIIQILINNEISSKLHNELEKEEKRYSQKGIFRKIFRYLSNFAKFKYNMKKVIKNLLEIVKRDCIKSKKKNYISYEEVMEFC